MNQTSSVDAGPANQAGRGTWKRVSLSILGIVAAVVLAIGLILWAKYRYLRAHADSLLRDRMIASLSARFHSPVELDTLHLDPTDGVHVTGTGLRILYLAGPTVPNSDTVPGQPMLSIDSFEFQTNFIELFKPTTRILTVFVRGMQLNIPPRRPPQAGQNDDPKRKGQPKISIVVDKIVCVDSKIVVETTHPGKLPLVFDIASATLMDVGVKKPLLYDATLTNPKPVGQIRATGHFGPWQADNPRDTPIDGTYWFTHADLSTFRGIAGMLSATGNYTGTLGQIAIIGKTDVPDFRLDTGDHPVPLHTDFHAIVDGLSGDTYLKQVDVRLLNSRLHASGSITRIGTSATGVTGHDTELTVTATAADRCRIEDLLVLAVKTVPPVLRGGIVMQQHFSLPPGKTAVANKIRLHGNFTISDATFGNPGVQTTVDKLSMRAQGHPEDANPLAARKVESTLNGNFTQANAVLNFSNITYTMPGASVRLTGEYSLDGERFEFQGDMRTEATMSEMTTGWKSMLLKPFDSLLKRDGAGVELPVTISGTKSAPKFGVDTKRLFR